MKRRLFYLFVLVFIGRCALAAAGREPTVATAPIYDQLGVRIPATLFKKPVYLIVDTGAGMTYIDAKYRDELGASIDDMSVNTVTTTNVPVLLYHAPPLNIGGRSFNLDKVGCLDFSALRAATGVPFAGMLGMDLLQRYVITFDPDQEQFSLTTNVPAIVKQRALAIPLTRADNGKEEILQLSARLNGSGPINLVLDSGAFDFLGLNQADWDKVFPDDKEPVVEDFNVGADSKIVRSKAARIRSLRIGASLYTNILVGLVSNPTSFSHIGDLFLRQHIAALDVSNQVLYLLPSRHFGETNELDMSGLHLLKLNSKIMAYMVDSNSPAFKAGIRDGAELVAINGQPAGSVLLSDIRQILRKADGMKISLEIKQAGQVKEANFRLKKRI
ncbi:MAG TPA: aspartyl protease family protein [Verrucomicrobiae bacterium]|jgi:hypothetical protein